MNWDVNTPSKTWTLLTGFIPSTDNHMSSCFPLKIVNVTILELISSIMEPSKESRGIAVLALTGVLHIPQDLRTGASPSSPGHSLERDLILLSRCSRHILQPQLTGLRRGGDSCIANVGIRGSYGDVWETYTFM